MLGGEKAAVAFHGDHHPVKVATHRKSRNILPVPYLSNDVVTENGITFTKNEDGTITVNGTSTGPAIFTFSSPNNSVGIESGKKYIISGCPEGGASSEYYLRVSDNKTIAYDDYGNGRGISFSYDDVSRFYVFFQIRSAGITFDNAVVRPMLEEGTVAHTYEPYGTIEQIIHEPAESTKSGASVEFEGTYNDAAEVSVAGRSTQDGTPTPDAPVPIESIKSVELVSRNADGSKSATRTIDLQGHELRSLPDGTHDELVVHRDGTVELVQRVYYCKLADKNFLGSPFEQPGSYGILLIRDLPRSKTDSGSYADCTNILCNIGKGGRAETEDRCVIAYTPPETDVLAQIYFYQRIGDNFPFQSVPTRTQFLDWWNDREFYVQYCLATPQTIQLPSIDPLPTYYPYTFVDGNGADISARVRVMP